MHPRSLNSTFVVHCLDSIIPILAKSNISRPHLVSSAEQTGLSLENPKDRFSSDMAHMIVAPPLYHFGKQCRPRSDLQTVASDQGLHPLDTDTSIKDKKYTKQSLNVKWMCPINK